MKKWLSTVIGGLVLIITVIVSIYGFLALVDNRIKDIINDEDFIRKVASNVRPYVIFDEKGSVLVDGGGMQYLQKTPEITSINDKGFRILVTPKKHLPTAPIVESLTLTQYLTSYNRGNGYEWICDLKYLGGIIEDDVVKKFRLEIVK